VADWTEADAMKAVEVATVVSIYRAGGRVKIVQGENEPQKEIRPEEKPILKIPDSWYYRGGHEQLMTVMQGFLNDIKGGLANV